MPGQQLKKHQGNPGGTEMSGFRVKVGGAAHSRTKLLAGTIIPYQALLSPSLKAEVSTKSKFPSHLPHTGDSLRTRPTESVHQPDKSSDLTHTVSCFKISESFF